MLQIQAYNMCIDMCMFVFTYIFLFTLFCDYFVLLRNISWIGFQVSISVFASFFPTAVQYYLE